MAIGVYDHYKIRGKSFRKFKDLKLNIKKIINLYLRGEHINNLTKKYCINKNQLYLILNKYSISRKKNIYVKRQKINSIQLTNTEKAYIAGLFDGEGCLHKKDKKFWSIYIANTNVKVMNWLLKKINNGGIYKKQKIINDSNHICYVWQSAKQNVIFKFLTLIEPYCIIKK